MKNRKIYYRSLWIIGLFMMILVSCGKKEPIKDNFLAREITQEEKENITKDLQAVIEICKEQIYLDSILEALGKQGYSAIDRWNTRNLQNKERAEEFCKKLTIGESDTLVLYQILEDQLVIRIELQAQKQKLGVTRTAVQWEPSGEFTITAMERFQADSWKYTKKGYLFYKKEVPEGFDGPNGVETIRIKPLEEEYREMCEAYLLPIGYSNQNLFLINWTEQNLSQINIMDLYEYLYQAYFKKSLYNINYPSGIPAEEFEEVVSNYFDISKDDIQQWGNYDMENKVYNWRERQNSEYSFQSVPTPEVVGYQKNIDDTLTLTVDAVWPEHDTDQAFTHEVTIRILENGKFQYVGNKIIESQENEYPVYVAVHLNREGKSIGNKINYSKNILEKQEQEEIIQRAEEVWELCFFNENEIEEILKQLEDHGQAGIAKDKNMVHYEKMLDFYENVKQEEDAQITLYDIKSQESMEVITFTSKNKKLQEWSFMVTKEEKGTQGTKIKEIGIFTIDDIRLTQKGYLIYHIEEAENINYVPSHAAIRVMPLPEECREMQAKYLKDFYYFGNNMFLINWNKKNIDKLYFIDIFEYLYQLDTKEIFYTDEKISSEIYQIPAEIFENTITKYFPIKKEELKNSTQYYSPFENSYLWTQNNSTERFPPFPEVVAVEKKKDGSIVLQIDAVWINENTDCAFQNFLTIQPRKNNEFWFIENRVEPEEKEIPEYIPRVLR